MQNKIISKTFLFDTKGMTNYIHIMLPDVNDLSKWAVIACDQFTSQPDYWENVKEIAGGSPSAYNLILPEALLNDSDDTKILQINSAMDEYLSKNLFTLYKDSYIYVERKLPQIT